MSTNNLFETTLMATKHRGIEPMSEGELAADQVEELIRFFAEGIDLETSLEDNVLQFSEHMELDDEGHATFVDLINDLLESAEINEEETAKSFLKDLAKPYAKAERRFPNQEGLTPLAGETGTKAFLKKLPVDAHPDPYGNEGFSADKYKAFDRETNRFGYNYTAKNDYNNQSSDYPLQNPILNVNTSRSNVYEAIDSVGMGIKVHYRVLNKLTNEYVTHKIEKDQAEQIAADLNNQMHKQSLDEAVSRKDFRQVSNIVRAIEDPKKRQEFADHHAAIFSKQNANFSHQKWHQACGTTCPSKLHQEAAKPIPSVPLQENLFKPLNPAYAEYINKSVNPANSRVMDGGAYQSTNPAITAVADFKATAMLNERAKAKFVGNTKTTEHQAIRSKQLRNLPRRSDTTVNFDSSSDRDFLAGMNSRSLIGKK
jgi:hypothetical protein